MIPTRLNQSYNNGTVMGFNSRTGSILVFANSTVYVPVYSHDSFDVVRSDSLKNFPKGYQWPTIHDFYSVGTRLSKGQLSFNLSFFTLIDRLNLPRSSSYEYFLTCNFEQYDHDNIYGYFMCMFYLVDRQTALIRSVSYRFNDGHLLPVYYITGSNCDTN